MGKYQSQEHRKGLVKGRMAYIDRMPWEYVQLCGGVVPATVLRCFAFLLQGQGDKLDDAVTRGVPFTLEDVQPYITTKGVLDGALEHLEHLKFIAIERLGERIPNRYRLNVSPQFLAVIPHCPFLRSERYSAVTARFSAGAGQYSAVAEEYRSDTIKRREDKREATKARARKVGKEVGKEVGEDSFSIADNPDLESYVVDGIYDVTRPVTDVVDDVNIGEVVDSVTPPIKEEATPPLVPLPPSIVAGDSDSAVTKRIKDAHQAKGRQSQATRDAKQLADRVALLSKAYKSHKTDNPALPRLLTEALKSVAWEDLLTAAKAHCPEDSRFADGLDWWLRKEGWRNEAPVKVITGKKNAEAHGEIAGGARHHEHSKRIAGLVIKADPIAPEDLKDVFSLEQGAA